mgnify:CR=1 FL=1
MSQPTSKRVLLIVTGGIAAYKALEIVRRLREAGAAIRVVMTPAAQRFVTPLSFQALSGEPVHCDLLDERAEAAMGHIELARWADLVVIAPASADFLARLRAGLADNLATTLCLATTAPLLVAPAMRLAPVASSKRPKSRRRRWRISPRRCSRTPASSLPPVQRRKRSIRCGTSATGVRGRWVMPSRRPPLPPAPRSP